MKLHQLFEAINDHFTMTDTEFREKMKDQAFKAEYIAHMKAKSKAQEDERAAKEAEKSAKNKAELSAAVAKRADDDAKLEKSIEDGSLRQDVMDELKADGDSDEVAKNKTSTRAKLINLAGELGLI